jgi:hypothetical protein
MRILITATGLAPDSATGPALRCSSNAGRLPGNIFQI